MPDTTTRGSGDGDKGIVVVLENVCECEIFKNLGEISWELNFATENSTNIWKHNIGHTNYY